MLVKGSSPKARFQCVFGGLTAQVHEFGILMAKDLGAAKEQREYCVKILLHF